MRKMKQKIWEKRNIQIKAMMGTVLAATIMIGGCGTVTPQKQTSVDTAMGTIVSQTLYVQPGTSETEGLTSSGETTAETGVILELLKQLEQQELSWRVEGSEVAQINALVQEETEPHGDNALVQEETEPHGDNALMQEETGTHGDNALVQEETEPHGDNALVQDKDIGEPGQKITISLSTSMQQLLAQIWQVSEDSGGALDVTIGGLSRLWNLDGLAGMEDYGDEELYSIPTDEQIQAALADIGYERVQLSDGEITLPAGVQLDLGAVGKGIACDRINEYLHSQPEITGAVVAVGGSVVTYGLKPDGSAWTVAVMHPRKEGSYLGTLKLTGEHYVSTSGDYERYIVVDGVRYHHILEPATGYPANSGLCSVTIVCDNGLQADALSTACFILGSERGLALAESYGAEALLVAEDGQLYMTEGMQEMFTAE